MTHMKCKEQRGREKREEQKSFSEGFKWIEKKNVWTFWLPQMQKEMTPLLFSIGKISLKWRFRFS